MGTPNMMYQETLDYIKELKESYGLVVVRNNVLAERVAELEAETDNLKAIMLGEGGTKKVDLKQRYKGEAK